MPPNLHPRLIPGRWKLGYALDLHTTASVYQGDDEFGHPVFETTRTEIGEFLFRLKYRNDTSVVDDLAGAAAAHARAWALPLDVIAVVPPSRARPVQPVELVAGRIGALLRVPFVPRLVREVGRRPELKDVYDYDERLKILSGAFECEPGGLDGMRVLLFDDLYRSGASMNAVADVLYSCGRATDVLALAITQTRSHR